MAGKHDVYVYKAGRTYKARPAMWAGRAGKTFRIRNVTDVTLKIDLPHGLTKHTKPVTITPNKSKTFRIGGHADGLYSYHIEVVRRGLRNEVVRGESDPEMIIDP